ncbi:hypothetical protein ATK30_1036 [Amycolatopsis echigonensis]|uniref:Uncharacterized protein n=1 Tax=Amycolatopsis echigonensis TaxID=2576905 RepID=A0A2N3W8T6_9PSEU|nr:hypothetical protein ATK30_1036 [Amycolatopsis niigatensis]
MWRGRLCGDVEVDVTVSVRIKSQLSVMDAEVHKRAVVRARFVLRVPRQFGRICYRNFPVFVGAGCSLSTLGRWPARSHSMVWTL